MLKIGVVLTPFGTAVQSQREGRHSEALRV